MRMTRWMMALAILASGCDGSSDDAGGAGADALAGDAGDLGAADATAGEDGVETGGGAAGGEDALADAALDSANGGDTGQAADGDAGAEADGGAGAEADGDAGVEADGDAGVEADGDAVVEADGDTGADDAGDVAVVPADAILCATESFGSALPPLAWRLVLSTTDAGLHVDAERSPAHEYPSPPVPADMTKSGAAAGEASASGVSFTFEGWSIEAMPTGVPGLLAGTGAFGDDGTLALSCWTVEVMLPFQYDPATGTCKDSGGQTGRNATTVPYVRETGNGHCADLSGLPLNEDDLAYPELNGWDLRGADLSGATLSFAGIYDAQLEGADLESLTYGYAWVTGSTDEHTIPPASGCKHEESWLSCMQ